MFGSKCGVLISKNLIPSVIEINLWKIKSRQFVFMLRGFASASRLRAYSLE